MIYAKVKSIKASDAGNEHVLIHFYGGSDADAHAEAIRVWGLHPFSYLAKNDFIPISDITFYKK